MRKNFGTNMKSVLLVFVAFENNFPNLKGKKENVRKNFCANMKSVLLVFVYFFLCTMKRWEINLKIASASCKFFY